MAKQFKHISHKLIDTLSDGVFSIALTLLGLDVLSLAHGISKSEDFNGAMFEHWPTFLLTLLAFCLIFLVVSISRNKSIRSRNKYIHSLEP